MAGYTPIFDSVFQGSLCGKYPDLPVWLVLLALQQRGGIIDAHPSYIAMISGISQEDIEAAIERFCQPDPRSRTPDHDGRRLEPIPGAGFGWRVINHRKYQEKARLEARNAREVAEGKNAERMRQRANTPADPRRPPQTPADRPSNSNSNNEEEIYVGLKPDVESVFRHWQTVHGKPRAKLDDKRKRLIRAALKTYSADDLCRSIDGYKRSAFHQGKNDTGKVFDSIELMLRDAKQIEQGWQYSDTGHSEVVRWR